MYKKIILIIILYLIIIIRIIDIKYFKYESYYESYLLKSDNKLVGNTAPRGRILDNNGIVIVDNKKINNITYRKIKNNNIKEIDIAKYLESIIDVKEADNYLLKKYYVNNNDTSYLLSENEINDYNSKKISLNDIINIKIERIKDEIDIYNSLDKRIINIYYLMQDGYLSDTKIIKEDVSDEICASITEKNIIGLSCDISWKRINNYPYLSTIVGSIGLVPQDNINYYLDMGYDNNDYVGISGLEKEYDYLLKGEKAIYEVDSNNNINVIKDEVRGNDLVLSLDINIENKSFELLEKYLLLAKKMNNTEFYNHAYILVSNPNTGEIISIAGLLYENDNFKDISINAITSSYTVGSIVKGASHTVGYINNLIDIDKKINDSCVKLYSVPEKCSFKRLGLLNDIDALKMSSNYYQFITAIKSTGNIYKNNMKLEVNEEDFDRYRNIFKLYGLGSSTGIDFPKESLGLKGNTIAPDLFLNLSIGQYDNYTPLQLLSYINTIANNGIRMNLSFKKQDNNVMDVVPLDSQYMKRIQKGFYEVVNNGTGKGYTDYKYKAVGKTGTSESYYDNKTITINQSYVMYAPIDEPKYSMVIVNPNLSYNNDYNNYIAPINRMISKEMSDFLFSK